MDEWKEHEMDCEDCEYCEQSYYEYDTGYCEYECTFMGECMEKCPLSFKYKIER